MFSVWLSICGQNEKSVYSSFYPEVYRVDGKIIYPMSQFKMEMATMSELKQRILDIIHKPQLASLATVTELNNPWVRYVVTVGDGNFVLRCATLVESRKVQQIKNNPNVHLTCGVSSFLAMQPYLQIQAKARVATDKDERHNFWNDMLAPMFTGPDDPKYAVIVIEPYRIESCTPGSYQPEIWTR